jgi:hypothetical protein
MNISPAFPFLAIGTNGGAFISYIIGWAKIGFPFSTGFVHTRFKSAFPMHARFLDLHHGGKTCIR